MRGAGEGVERGWRGLERWWKGVDRGWRGGGVDLLPVERGVATLRLECGEARLTLGGRQLRQAVDAHEERIVEQARGGEEGGVGCDSLGELRLRCVGLQAGYVGVSVSTALARGGGGGGTGSADGCKARVGEGGQAARLGRLADVDHHGYVEPLPVSQRTVGHTACIGVITSVPQPAAFWAAARRRTRAALQGPSGCSTALEPGRAAVRKREGASSRGWPAARLSNIGPAALPVAGSAAAWTSCRKRAASARRLAVAPLRSKVSHARTGRKLRITTK